MKTISLLQPWASLVAIGAKRIETRSWATRYRGPIAIHASKAFSLNAQELCGCDPFREVLMKASIYWPCVSGPFITIPRGCVIATATLWDCIWMDDGDLAYSVRGKTWKLTEQERAFGDYSRGRFAWLLDNVVPLPVPVPARGSLGLWECSFVSSDGCRTVQSGR